MPTHVCSRTECHILAFHQAQLFSNNPRRDRSSAPLTQLDGLHPVHEKVQAIKEAPTLSNVTKVKAYLGLLNYYNKFLPNLSTVLDPVHKLLHKDIRWQWRKAQQAAFEKSKAMMPSAEVPVQYDLEKDIVLSCDTSTYGVSAVLSHFMPDGTERPIGFTSRTLNMPEKNYNWIRKVWQ